MPGSTLTPFFAPRSIELLEANEQIYERWCRTALFGTVHIADTAQMRQASLILAGLKVYETDQDMDVNMPSNGFGQIARVECFWDSRGTNYGWREYRGMVIYTSGSGYTDPIVHYSGALLGYGGSGPALGRYILTQCGIPEELVKYCEDELEHHDYRVVFSREAITVEDGLTQPAIFSPPNQKWRLVHKEKYRREM